MNISHFFIDRPIFAAVISILITLIGGVAYFSLPVAQYPDIAPPSISVTATYPGASADIVAKTVATPIEQEVNGVENMLYMTSQSTSDGAMSLAVTFKLGTNLDTAQVLVQNRVAIAAAAPARGGAQHRRHGGEAVARPDDGDPSLLAGRLARPALHLQLRDAAREGRARPHRRRRRRHHLRRARLFDAHLARSGEARRARSHRRRRGQRAARAERAGGGGRHQSAAGAATGRLPAQRGDARAPHRSRFLRQYHREIGVGRARGPHSRHRPRRARRRRLQSQRLSRQDGWRSRWASSSARDRTPCKRPRPCRRPWRSCRSRSPRASNTTSSTTRPCSSRSRSTR